MCAYVWCWLKCHNLKIIKGAFSTTVCIQQVANGKEEILVLIYVFYFKNTCHSTQTYINFKCEYIWLLFTSLRPPSHRRFFKHLNWRHLLKQTPRPHCPEDYAPPKSHTLQLTHTKTNWPARERGGFTNRVLKRKTTNQRQFCPGQ